MTIFLSTSRNRIERQTQRLINWIWNKTTELLYYVCPLKEFIMQMFQFQFPVFPCLWISSARWLSSRSLATGLHSRLALFISTCRLCLLHKMGYEHANKFEWQHFNYTRNLWPVEGHHKWGWLIVHIPAIITLVVSVYLVNLRYYPVWSWLSLFLNLTSILSTNC